MNKAWQVAKVMIIELKRDRAAWVSMLLVPVLLTLIMGVLFGGFSSGERKSKIPVIDHDQSRYSKLLLKQLKKEPAFLIVKGEEKKARDDIRKGKIAAAIIIPDGFGEALRQGKETDLNVIQLKGSGQAIGISQIMDGLAIRYSTNSTTAASTLNVLKLSGKVFPDQEEKNWTNTFDASDKAWETPPVTVKSTSLKASEVRGEKTLATGFSQTSMGFTITFVMFMVVMGATTLLEERQKNTLGRLLTTPTKKASILSGKIIGIFMTGAIQAAILILVGRFVFQVDWGRSPLQLLFIMSVFIFSMAAMGILISSLVRTLAQANSISPVIIISLAMLGGCYWPIEITPPFMQKAANGIPTGWMMRGLTDLIVRGRGWDAVLVPSVIIFGFGVVFLSVGLVFLRFE